MTDAQRTERRADALAKVASDVAEENSRLRTALEFYANSTSWRLSTSAGGYTMTGPGAGDPTELARRALEGRACYVARPLSPWRSFWKSVRAFLKPRRAKRPFPP